MRVIAVGGEAKNIGKTTLVCNIIAAFPQIGWTAIKFSTHAHVPVNVELVIETKGISIWRQSCAGDDSDTARFLKAGAQRGFLVLSEPSDHRMVSEILRKQLPPAAHVIIESTQVAELLNPDLFLLVINSAAVKLKKPAPKLFESANAFIRRAGEGLATGIELNPAGKPIFESRREGLAPELASLISDFIRTPV